MIANSVMVSKPRMYRDTEEENKEILGIVSKRLCEKHKLESLGKWELDEVLSELSDRLDRSDGGGYNQLLQK